MFKRIISVFVAAALAAGICAPTASAAKKAGAGTVGRAVADGEYTLTFRSDASLTDVGHDFYYSESFFASPATEYDHALATASLGLALAAFSTAESDYYYWIDGSVGREANIAAAYSALGFENAEFYNYDASLNSREDYAAYSLAQKTIKQNGSARTVIALIVRGGGYGSEWTSNVKLGSGAVHTGFESAANEAFASLKAYLSAAAARGELGEVNLWICGYSRGGAVANLLAAMVSNELTDIKKENTYVYTFAAPAVMTAAAPEAYKLDFDSNHTSAGELKQAFAESNVHNILGSGDIVPQLPPANWGYRRNGSDRYLPLPASTAEAAALTELAGQINPYCSLDFSQMATSSDVNALISSLEKVFTSRSVYLTGYQSMVMDMLECAFQRSEDEVVLGAVLGNEAVFQRLHSLGNTSQFDWDKIVTSVWLASAASRPLLERYGGNVPLRVQQMIIPLVATGLCYDIESNVLHLLAQFIIGMVSAGGIGQSANVYKSHYPETYIALMEYYGPETHTLEPHSAA